MELTSLDRQKTRLLLFFSALGLGGFVFHLIAGIGLWSYGGPSQVAVPTYDLFVGELRATSQAALPELARTMFENWSACAGKLSGMGTVAVHALITGSVVGIVFFGICFVLGWQLHQKVSTLVPSGAPPQPPESVDDTWHRGDR